MVLRFLNDLLQSNPPPDECKKIVALVWLADSTMEVLCNGPPFLAHEERQHVSVVGNAMLRLYVDLCHDEPSNWRVRPKFHLCWHMINDPLSRAAGRNPSKEGTWLDEDWIKKIQRVCKRCHKVTARKTVLQRYLIGLQQKLRLATSAQKKNK